MRRASLTVGCIMGACFSLAACLVPPLDPVLTLSSDALRLLDEGILPDRDLDKQPLAPDAVPIYLALRNDKAADSAEVQRAAIIGLMNRSDSMCEKYMVDVLVFANTTSAVLGVGNVTLGAAATATTGSTATGLAGAATAATGVKTGLANDVLGGKSADILYRGVMARRGAERLVILGLLEQKTNGFEKAMAHLSNYHTLCGPAVGIGEISASLDRTEEDASKLAGAKIEAINKATADKEVSVEQE